jgi:hypothetical protein
VSAALDGTYGTYGTYGTDGTNGSDLLFRLPGQSWDCQPQTANCKLLTRRPDRRIRAKSDCFCVPRPVLTVRVILPWMGFWRLDTGAWREKLVSSQFYQRAGTP